MTAKINVGVPLSSHSFYCPITRLQFCNTYELKKPETRLFTFFIIHLNCVDLIEKFNLTVSL